MSEWYKHGLFWRKASPGWELEKYGCVIDSCGDLIYNTCNKIIEDQDFSEWAKLSIIRCKELLDERKRWPDEMEPLNGSENRVEWWISRLKYRLKIKTTWMEHDGEDFVPVKKLTVKYRPQSDVTRDPWIAFYAACAMFDFKELIISLTVPLHLYRPNLWAWRKYLITGKEKYKRRYYFWERFSVNEPDYAQRLSELMEI